MIRLVRYTLMINLVLIMLMSAVYANSLPSSEFCLGGIRPGSSMDYVRSIYGEPKFISKKNGIKKYVYGESLFLDVHEGSERVFLIETTANNGFATPSGLTVGMSVSDLFALYGPEELEKNNRTGETFYMYPHRGAGAGCSMQVFVTGNRISVICIAG